MLYFSCCSRNNGVIKDLHHKSIYIASHTDPFPKRHRLVHNGGFPKFEALYCSVNIVNSTEISQNLSYKVQSFKSQSRKPIQTL